MHPAHIGTMTSIVRTAEEFDALEHDTLVICVEVIDPTIAHWRRRTLWRKFGRGWAGLDPTDRNDGETVQPSGYLENLLTGFGNARRTPGMALVPGDGEFIDFAYLSQLPVASVISVGDDDIFTHEGDGRWTEMNAADRDDGDYPLPTSSLPSYGYIFRVLYRPGDEERVD